MKMNETIKAFMLVAVVAFSSTVITAAEDLLAVSLLSFGVLQVDLRWGDVREQLSDLRPEVSETTQRIGVRNRKQDLAGVSKLAAVGLTSSCSGCRRTQPCRSTGPSRRAERLQRIAWGETLGPEKMMWTDKQAEQMSSNINWLTGF